MNLPSRLHKRGLSTVVTSAILLAAVAIMGAMIVSWSDMKFSNQQMAMSATFSDSINKINEDLLIDHVWFVNSVPKVANVTLTNTGSLALNVTEIKFIDPTDGSTIVTQSITDGRMLVHKSYSTNVTYSWISKVPIDVIATTERGNIIQTQVAPP